MLTALLLALAQDVEIVVEAGKHDRRNVPVRARADVTPGDFLILDETSGKSFYGQASPGEIAFVLPELKAGQSVTLKASPLKDKKPSERFAWRDAAGESAELSFGARPVLRYMYKSLDDSSKESREQSYKVFHHLFDPSGRRLVTKGPGGKYTHHRGIYYGFNNTTYAGKKVDIWHCSNAHQAHEKFLAVHDGLVFGRHVLQIAWHGVGKEVFAREERALTVYHVPGGTLVEFASRLTPVLAPLKLDGDPQHAGFHFRADNEVAETTAKQTVFIRPDGPGKPGETRNWPAQKEHVNLPWNAMSFVLGGTRYTAAYLDRPENPKEARFSERDYGRFGSYFVHTLEEGKPLEVRYRLWLQEGEMKPEEVAAKSADFVEPPKVTVR
jgi:hypothetical protein